MKKKLEEYKSKRKFSETPEPKGGVTSRKGHKLVFVVQEHQASRLHYDFRLELDGVLKSWAIPKGPSLNPHEHHLAIQTEDHPLEYRNFEGVIPEGNYGAGDVIIWDQGWYTARKGKYGEDEKTLRAELKKGHLTFILHGKKLKGEFALIKMQHARDENAHSTSSGQAWLLVKKNDEYATQKDITKQNTSVKSHKRIEDLSATGALPDISNYPRKAAPWRVDPMLCTLVDEPFSKAGWLFEIKWDGYRAVASRHKNKIELSSRNHLDFSAKYAPITEALRGLKHNVILDGEIVAVDSSGRPHFEWLQNWHRDPVGALQYQIFDILWCDGHDVRTMPLDQRKLLLKSILPESDVLRYGDHVEVKGEDLFDQVQKQDLEGIIVKRADSPYREGERGSNWLKIKTHLRQEVVIGGYTEPRGGRAYLGSLLVGVYENGGLVYVGHSGGGIPDDQRRELRERLEKLEVKKSPFTTEPKPNAPVHWVKPRLVCELSFREWTQEGIMRQPTFQGLRPDKKPTEVHREKPRQLNKTTKSGLSPKTASSGYPFEPTHLDKVFFPKTKYTKGDLFKYYESIADYILPYLEDRPHSLNRMPHGINGESFYQKNNEHLPDWVPHEDIFSESNNENLRWIVGKDLSTLLYMVQLGCIEINPWNSRVGHLDHPDWIVIDLDPEGVGFDKVIQVARVVKKVCDEWVIPTHPKTSGKTGLHIYIPMQAKYTYEQAKNFAHLIVLEVNRREPKITSVERMPEKRRHKIYLDYLQNREGQTLAAPYSVRPTPEATVSMPLHWDEVAPGLKQTDFTIKNVKARLGRTGDLWKPILGKGINLASILKKIE